MVNTNLIFSMMCARDVKLFIFCQFVILNKSISVLLCTVTEFLPFKQFCYVYVFVLLKLYV